VAEDAEDDSVSKQGSYRWDTSWVELWWVEEVAFFMNFFVQVFFLLHEKSLDNEKSKVYFVLDGQLTLFEIIFRMRVFFLYCFNYVKFC